MIRKPVTINLSTGLEARPVAQLVQVASRYNSEVYVEIGRKKVNAKSIMGMMTLGIDAGEETVGVIAGQQKVAGGNNERGVVGVMVLGVKVLRRRVRCPDEAVVAGIALVLGIIDNVFSLCFIKVPTVAAVYGFFQ